MTDKSHRDEMSAAIRAQRERQAVPRSIAGSEEAPAPPAPDPPAPDPEPAPMPEPAPTPQPGPQPELQPAARKGLFARLFGR
jgi:hypothetical protein